MQAAALSLAGVDTGSLTQYSEDLASLLINENIVLAVLPAHLSLKLFCASSGEGGADFGSAFQVFKDRSGEWNSTFLKLHAGLARDLGIFLAAGTTVERAGGRSYLTTYCFNPRGEICFAQRQTHLSREERSLGLSRGTELNLFDLGGLKAGVAAGTDAYHPEVGRILSLQGADLIIHPGALEGETNWIRQAAGMWAQVQQNQCWAVEAQLCGDLCGRGYSAECCIIGPCESTADLSGYLARVPAGAPAAVAELDETARNRVRQAYPILSLLNPVAYGNGLNG